MYRTVDAAFWTDPKVATLEPNSRFGLLYLITNPHSHVGGIYYLHETYMSLDTGLSDRVCRRVLDTLSGAGFVGFDREKSVVWVVNMFRYQRRGEKNERAVANALKTLHGSALVDEFLARYPTVRKYLEEPPRPKRAQISNALRFKVLDRYKFTCVYCGVSAPTASIEIDHRIPVNSGGSNDEDNLVAACWDCNNGKAYTLSGAVEGEPNTPSEGGTPIRNRTGTKQDQKQDQKQDSDGDTPSASPRRRDEAADRFASAYQANIGSPYGWGAGDFPQLSKLRKRIGGTGAVPNSWEIGIENYFATPLPEYSLKHFAAKFDTFKNSPLDRYGKPIYHANGGTNGESKTQRIIKQTNKINQQLSGQDPDRHGSGDGPGTGWPLLGGVGDAQ